MRSNPARFFVERAKLHEDSHRHLPTGGWGWKWHGDPNRGFDRAQPGGWIYNLLPFVEQQALRQRGAGLADALKGPK